MRYVCEACHDSGFLTVLDTTEAELSPAFPTYIQTATYCPLACVASQRVRIARWSEERAGMRRQLARHRSALDDGSFFGLPPRTEG